MKKSRVLVWAVIGILALGVIGCGKKEGAVVPEEPVSQSLNVGFINETEADVGFLRIRPTAEAEWSENLLQEEVWKVNYEVPVSLNGILPETAEGWQVQMTFLDTTEVVWTGVMLADQTTVTFTNAEGNPQAVVATRETVEETAPVVAPETDVVVE